MQIRVTDFLAAFFPSLDEPICLRAFKAKGDPAKLPPRKLHITRRRLSDDAALQAQLQEWNQTLGLYYVVNAGGDSAHEITRFNAFFAEIDDVSIAWQHQLFDRAPILPSPRVETRKSVHAYWLIEGECAEKEWRDMQQALIAYFQSDPKIKDPSRVIRLPNFNHIAMDENGQRNYHRVEIVAFESTRRFTVAEMQEAFLEGRSQNAERGSKIEGRSRNDERGRTMSPDSSVSADDSSSFIAPPSDFIGSSSSFIAPPSDFSTWSSLHTELRRRMLAHPTCTVRSEWAHLQGICHNGKGTTALFLNLATNAYGCQKEPPCDSATILHAFGLPEKPDGATQELGGREIGRGGDGETAGQGAPLIARPSFPPSPNLLLSPSFPQWPDPPSSIVFHRLAGKIIRLIDPHTEADPVALLIQLLVAFGNIIGRVPYFVADGAAHYLNLFAVLVGVSSKSRKGTSWAQIGRLLRKVDEDWAEKRILSGLSSGEGTIWAVRDAIEKKEVIRDKGHPTNEYKTVITDHGVEDKRLLIQEPEFASVLRVMGREGNTLSAILRQAWDTGNLRVLTKNNPAQATNAHISIIGHITRDELRRYLDATESGNGFGNRFLWVCVKRSKLLPEGGEEVLFGAVTRRLQEAMRLADFPARMDRDLEARALWREVYPELSEGKPGLLGALTGRAEAQTMRLAALYALLDKFAVICRVHLEAALALWQYCEHSARFIFGESFDDPVADAILRVLREAGEEGLTRNQLRDFFQRHVSSSALSHALQTLAEAGQVKSIVKPTGGRPSERWFALLPTAMTPPSTPTT